MYYDVGDSLIITCEVIFEDTKKQYINKTVQTTIKWKKVDNVVNSTTSSNSLELELPSLMLSNNNDYVCEGFVNVTSNQYIKSSSLVSESIEISIIGKKQCMSEGQL